jgi:hypothetical protein
VKIPGLSPHPPQTRYNDPNKFAGGINILPLIELSE